MEILRQRDLPVRTFVRCEEERVDALRRIGAEVVVGDLTRAADVARASEVEAIGEGTRVLGRFMSARASPQLREPGQFAHFRVVTP